MSKLPRSFHSCARSIATASTESELRSRFMDSAGELFGASAWGITFPNTHPSCQEVDFFGVPEQFVTRYREVGIDLDPVRKFAIERHLPAHQHLVMTAEDWLKSIVYQYVYAPYGLQSMMKGPIVGNGYAIGTVQFSRHQDLPPFSTDDLMLLGGICAHLSARLAILQSGLRATDTPANACLTQREWEIASLVARGLSNIEIATDLQIAPSSVKQALKRMFRKLSVSSRAHMVAILYR